VIVINKGLYYLICNGKYKSTKDQIMVMSTMAWDAIPANKAFDFIKNKKLNNAFLSISPIKNLEIIKITI